MKNCCYCLGSFEDEECRPYGTNGADTCYSCAMKPENKPTADKMVQAAIDRALEYGTGGIYIGHHTGPLPLPKNGDEGNN